MSSINSKVKDLLQVASPDGWKEWLTQIQADLISCGHLEGMTHAGSSEFAGNFLALQQFFTGLKQPVKPQSLTPSKN